MDAVLHALTEPNRRMILKLVAKQEMNAGQIAANFRITRPAVSQHLSILKQANLIRERREGTQRFYQTSPEGLSELRSYLESFWDEGLNKLKVAVETEQRTRHDQT
jgi:DNA-binding transcriptional ArsR family regulator